MFGEYMSAIATPRGPPMLLGCVRPLRELPLIINPEAPMHRRVLYLVGSSVNERGLQLQVPRATSSIRNTPPPPLQDNMVAVPYPSNRHHHPGLPRPLAWVHAAQRALQANTTLQEPPWTPPALVSMIFAWPFNSLQAAVYEDCDARPSACRSAAWDHGHPARIAATVQSSWYQLHGWSCMCM